MALFCGPERSTQALLLHCIDFIRLRNIMSNGCKITAIQFEIQARNYLFQLSYFQLSIPAFSTTALKLRQA